MTSSPLPPALPSLGILGRMKTALILSPHLPMWWILAPTPAARALLKIVLTASLNLGWEYCSGTPARVVVCFYRFVGTCKEEDKAEIEPNWTLDLYCCKYVVLPRLQVRSWGPMRTASTPRLGSSMASRLSIAAWLFFMTSLLQPVALYLYS